MLHILKKRTIDILSTINVDPISVRWYIAPMNSRHYDPEKLKKLREDKDLTQEQVAVTLNVHRQTIFRAEAGQNASYELLCALCDLYDQEVVSLLYPRPLEMAAA